MQAILASTMRPVPSAPLPLRQRLQGSRGFTIVELAIAALIIGVLAAIAIPSFKRSLLAARSDAVMNDLRVFAGSFQHYMQDKGEWPEDSAPGQYPPGMEQYLRSTAWLQKSAIGGRYNWEYMSMQNGTRVRAAIAVSSLDENLVSSDRVQLEDIDRRFDDGNLSTGMFRLGYELEPIYIIEP